MEFYTFSKASKLEKRKLIIQAINFSLDLISHLDGGVGPIHNTYFRN